MACKMSISNWHKYGTNRISLDNSASFGIMSPMLTRLRTYLVHCIFFMVAFASSLLIMGRARADIYRYVDEVEDTVHFTDAPTDKRFKVFMRDLKKDKELRTKLTYARSANPAEFEQLIKTYSEKYGVNQFLVKAVIHAESGYNPNAVSSKGAGGLMQLMPATAQSLKVADRFNPKDNVEGGVKYLRFLLDTFRGDISLAIAAYNAGLNKVAKYGGIPPYNETRTYVNRVLSYMKSYQENGSY
jgi:hypothetical protein